MKADILDIAKRRGFFWPSFEIYQGCSGFYTYGPLGTLLKLRIEKLIRDFHVMEEKCLLIESPILTIEAPWIASGHKENFTDMTIECGKCGEAYRADHLVEEKTGKSTNGLSLSEIYKIIVKNKIKCPKCSGNLGNVYEYNLMFETSIGPGKNRIAGVLRPETATVTYLSFKRLFEIGRKRIPLGVVQFGKSFRNEISPRQGLIRLREFSQAEVQFFIDPKSKNKHPKFNSVKNVQVFVLTKEAQKNGGKEAKMKIRDLVKKGFTNQWIAYYLAKSVQLFEQMGIDKRKLRCRQHKDDERSFYSSDTWDIEFLSDMFGRIELVGIADRGEYDLKRQMEFSKQDMRVDIDGKKQILNIIEVAYGIDRPLFCVLESCLKKDKDRIYLSFPPETAPHQVAVLPLVRKDGLPEKAKKIYEMLKTEGFYVLYDEEFIGRAYYRQDEAGTLYCITYDYDSLKDQAVTIRFRDNKKQIRVKIKKLALVLRGLINGELRFEKAGKVVK